MKAVVDFNQSLALQQGGITALTECADWPARLRTTYRSRRDGVLAALAARQWSVPCPEMGMYLWMPLPSQTVERGWCDEQVASDLLRRSGVVRRLDPVLDPRGVAGCGWLWSGHSRSSNGPLIVSRKPLTVWPEPFRGCGGALALYRRSAAAAAMPWQLAGFRSAAAPSPCWGAGCGTRRS